MVVWLCQCSGRNHLYRHDDAGTVVGVQNAKKLLEDIPNKIQSGPGIIADVNKHTKDGKDYLEIKVKPSAFPISYHGEFHYRSGATKQQLTGIALSEFIMQKTGFRWEDVTVDNITVKPYDSKLYNPDSARVFYRAGFIENWGQGIQKIYDECQNIGAELPAYELTGTTYYIADPFPGAGKCPYRSA